MFYSSHRITQLDHDFEDLKFTLYRAKFDTSKTASVTFVNDELPVRTLEPPIRTITGQQLVKVTHRDHHMYDPVRNNVTIAGVTSD